MKIKELPWYNKPSSKLVKNGVNSLDEAELLAIIFGNGNKKESALEMSNRLLKKYNLNGFDELGFNELKKECGGDGIKALRLISLVELSKRYNRLKDKGYKTVINSAEDVYNLLKDEFGNKKKEHFICLYLDTKNKVIKKEVVSVGTLNSSLVHPREVFKSAIRESANSVILVHNHPSGDCRPSENDERITNSFIDVGKMIGISVLDHVIIGSKNRFSFKEECLI